MLVPDLVKATDKLEATHPDVAGSIRAIRDINSIRVDLSHAFNFAQNMNAMSDEAQQAQANTAIEIAHHALFLGAIVLYSRAMKTRSDHRKTFDFRPRLTEQEREMHDQICGLRDDAVAHFGPGFQIGTAGFQTDGLFLAPSNEADGALRLMSVSRRTVVHKGFGARLLEHLRSTSLLVQKEFEDRETKLMDRLNQLGGSREVQEALQSSTTDLAEYMSSLELAELVFDANQIGPLVAVTNH